MSAVALRDSVRLEPGLLPAGLLTLLVHGGLFLFLFFGVDWKTYPPDGMVVDLWSELPELTQPSAEQELLPEKPAKSASKEKILPPKLEIPVPSKPDIALKILKKKIEKLQPVEKKQAVEADQKTEAVDDVAKLWQEQLAVDKKRQEASKKLQSEMGAQAKVRSSLTDEYKAKILAKIKSRIIVPNDLSNDPVAEFEITLLPGGDILEVKLRKSSGSTVWDSAVERAINLSKPLPLPPDPLLFLNFRNLSLKVHYRELSI